MVTFRAYKPRKKKSDKIASFPTKSFLEETFTINFEKPRGEVDVHFFAWHISVRSSVKR